MSSSTDFYRINVSANANINGQVFPVSGFSLNYHLDQIPDAFVTIPLGHSATGTTPVTNPVAMVASLVPYTPVTINLTATASPVGRDGPTSGLPVGSQVVFQGFIIRPGFVRTATATAIVFTSVGQTAGLCRSTRFGAGIIDGNPNNGSRLVTAKFGSGQKAIDTIYRILGANQNLYADIWINLLNPLLTGVTKMNESFDADNSTAKAALDRINAGAYLPVETLAINAQMSGTSLKVLDTGLSKCATDIFFNKWLNANDPFNPGNGDLWDAIEAFSQAFMFHFVPAVTEDAVAPITPGLGGAPYKIIEPADYWHDDFSTNFERKFDSQYNRVALITSAFVDTNYGPTSTSAPRIGYAEMPTSGKVNGQILVHEAPSFLIPNDVSTDQVLNVAGGNPDAVNPVVPPGVSGAKPAFDKAAVENDFFTSGLGDNYAMAALQEIMFAHRRMSLIGRLRLDIAPGSTVQVNIPGEVSSGLIESLFGLVTGVQVRVECGAGGSFAHTGFMVEYVRSTAEQKSYTVPYHPWYDVAWRGAPLVKM